MKKLIVTLALIVPSIVFARDLSVKNGELNFLMNAPLEKIKGKSEAIKGNVKIDEANLANIQGEFLVDLSKIATHTFDDVEKNKIQTSHMINWFEIGSDVTPEVRNKFQTASLKINGAKNVTKKSDTESLVAADAELTVHGITKTVPVEVLVTKAPDGKYTVATAKPVPVSLVAHDIKPRDLAGKLLQKTLETLSDEVAKTAEVNVNVVLD